MASRKFLIRQIFSFGNPPNLRAIASFHELVDITGELVDITGELVDIIGACRELKNHCNDNIDSLPKSIASFERATNDLRERPNQSSAHR